MTYLYLLKNSQTNKLYIGITNNLQRRIIEHNKNKYKFTGRNRFNGKWKLISFVIFDNKYQAKKEEERLKKAKNKKYVLWYFKNNSRAIPT